MTNLTDEGLREKAKEVVQFLPFAVEGVREDAFANHIFTILKQVRDAAKKEEREMIAVKADALDPLDTNSHGWEYGEMEQVAADIHKRYVKAIRQME